MSKVSGTIILMSHIKWVWVRWKALKKMVYDKWERDLKNNVEEIEIENNKSKRFVPAKKKKIITKLSSQNLSSFHVFRDIDIKLNEGDFFVNQSPLDHFDLSTTFFI